MGGGHLPKYLGTPIRSGRITGEDSCIDESEASFRTSRKRRDKWTASDAGPAAAHRAAGAGA
jgi:hypothetical protein